MPYNSQDNIGNLSKKVKKAYNKPTVEIKEEDNKGNRYSLPFGLCKGVGIDTTGMSPREAWEAYENKTGISKKEAEEKHWDKKEGNETELLADKNKKNTEDRENAIAEMSNSDRIIESKTFKRKQIAEEIRRGTQQMQASTANLFNQDNFGYRDNERDTAYYPGFNKVCLKKKALDDKEHYVDGDVFYHETWHAIDFNYGQEKDMYGRPRALSASYKASTGKTLNDTLVDETTHDVNWGEIKKTIEEEKKAYYKAQGYDVESINKKFSEIKAKLDGLLEMGRKSSNPEEYYNQWRELRFSEEGTKAIHDKERVLKNPPEMMKKWGALSDVYAGYTGGRGNLVGMGHKSWGAGSRGLEAFAEIASSKAVNQESYDLMKKYIPKTVAVFEEIYEKLEKGEIKHNGRTKYQP